MKTPYSLLYATAIAVTVLGVSCRSSSSTATKTANNEKKITAYWTELTQVPAELPSRPAPLPEVYRLLKLNMPALREHLAAKGKNEGATKEITIPMADGTLALYGVTEMTTIPKQLADKNPGLRAYSGKRKDDPTSNIRFELSQNGFSAMMSHPHHVAVVEPYIQGDTVHYISYFKNRRSIRHPNLRDMKNTRPAEMPEPNK